MAKKSSKASSPSWRTLRRQAAQATTVAGKEHLIKQSNQLRRAERTKRLKAGTPIATGWRKAGPKKPIRKVNPAVKRELDSMNHALYADNAAPVAQTQGWSPAPTAEEIELGRRAETLREVARRNGDTIPVIVGNLSGWMRSAELNGRQAAEESNAAVVANLIKQQGINVVASFIAQVNGMAAANRGPLPRSMVISGYVLARVVDALTHAGYTEDGFKSDGIRRPDRDGVINGMLEARRK